MKQIKVKFYHSKSKKKVAVAMFKDKHYAFLTRTGKVVTTMRGLQDWFNNKQDAENALERYTKRRKITVVSDETVWV